MRRILSLVVLMAVVGCATLTPEQQAAREERLRRFAKSAGSVALSLAGTFVSVAAATWVNSLVSVNGMEGFQK